MTQQRAWFVTGAGRGLGRAFVVAALEVGDSVAATARTPAVLDDLAAAYGDQLVVLPLDVTDRSAVVRTVAEAHGRLGRLDVVVNNAGYGQIGAIEELAEDEVRRQLDTNLLGAIWVSQAALPYLRAQGGGHVVQISTVGAVGTVPLFGLYNASKWGLEGFSSAMADEVAPFGIHVTMAQLGGFATDWAGTSMAFAESAIAAYAPVREAVLGMPSYPDDDDAPDAAADADADEPPEVAAAALLALVAQPAPPRRVIIGRGAHEMVAMALAWRRDEYARDPAFTWPAAPETS
ncbi:SDR family NAD(P)-dependent oxidoreductase [Mumia zhuanghuii]|uniref:SDR family NAD(P)-dependent oxidoreductase n=1 Tax=Mumia zhuanghuii TaxID=2585211 RepID=A0A5C4MJS8_9ACTN|nr:SDR family NAD(P)-dependent oxidoreductase [Mumia zhuanghuii]TNC42858.1 SDR family NAD(P)-dependent oxidoreductase [Mumia zhuanghuii]TNC43058.1 SDR family NAD(P)-dependent oxidoreductase [Mumia zhuanghuii]